MSQTAFKSPEGKAAYLAAYDAALKLWPVACEEIDVPTPFGTTHVIVSGPKEAPPLVLLHGYLASAIMWAPNIADLSERHRVYAIDTMGQPSKSVPGEPIRNAADYVAWLTATLDALHVDRVFLIGMSFGGWLALTFAAASPQRVRRLVLLSPGGVLRLTSQLRLRGLLMMLWPTPFTVRRFMRWVGLGHARGGIDVRREMDLMYLGIKHFRMPPETARIAADPLSDGDLRALTMPVLVLIGEDEVLYDAAAALARARRLIPDVQGRLIAHCSHDMCSSRWRIVDAHVLDFLERDRATDSPHHSAA